MKTQILELIFFIISGAGVFLIVISILWLKSEIVSDRISEYIVKEVPRSKQVNDAVAVWRMELKGSLFKRIFAPLLNRLQLLFKKTLPSHMIRDLEMKLENANYPYGLTTITYIIMRIILVGFGVVVAYILLSKGFTLVNVLGAFLGIIALLFLPPVWLSRRIRSRREIIEREIPDLIDMLSVSIAAGLSFDQALQRVSEQWSSELGDEVKRTIYEMEMGLSRKEALRNLASRLEIDELTSIISLIIQSEQLGMSIASTLHAISDQMRINWRYKLEEQMRKLPTKMLFPLVFLIFPAMLAILLGPSIPSLLDLFNTIK